MRENASQGHGIFKKKNKVLTQNETKILKNQAKVLF